ncbi:ral GTPase-activating protein subunit beta-like [Ciona intestinalis]
MEVLCFGLSLSLSEYDTLRDCVTIYRAWLSIATQPKPNLPKPLHDDPLTYVRRMIDHLQNLFVPRLDGSTSHQVSLCQSVLQTIQTIVRDSQLLDRETWNTLLMFVLKISDVLLAPPSQPSNIIMHGV